MAYNHRLGYAPSVNDYLKTGIYPTKSKKKDREIFWYFVEKDDIAGLKILLKKTPDVDFRTRDNTVVETPLFNAVEYDFPRTTELLLTNGANPNIRNSDGKTALFWAKSPKIIELLLKHGADINHQDSRGETVLHKLAKSQSDVHLRCISHLLIKGINLELRDQRGRSALHLAVVHENIEALKFMFKHRKIDVSGHVDQADNSPLDLIVYGCKNLPNKNCKCYKILYVLLSNEIKVSVTNPAFDENPCQILSWNRHLCNFREKMALLGLGSENLSPSKKRNRKRDARYEAELGKLKSIIISVFPKTIVLYDFLTFTISKASVYSKNENLVKLFKECKEDFDEKFPHFGFILNFKMKRGTTRRKLIDSATETLSVILADRLPGDCTEKIFQCFSEFELKEFGEGDYNFLRTKS